MTTRNAAGTRELRPVMSPTGLVHYGIADLTGERVAAGGSMWIGVACTSRIGQGFNGGTGMAAVRYFDETDKPVTCNACIRKAGAR